MLISECDALSNEVVGVAMLVGVCAAGDNLHAFSENNFIPLRVACDVASGQEYLILHWHFVEVDLDARLVHRGGNPSLVGTVFRSCQASADASASVRF